MTEDEPLRCQSCDHNVPRDRREDFGDACERWCEKCNRWLMWLDVPPCEKGRKASTRSVLKTERNRSKLINVEYGIVPTTAGNGWPRTRR